MPGVSFAAGLVVTAALGLAACGDSVSQEDADQQAQDAVTQALKEQRQKQQLAEVKAELKQVQAKQKKQAHDSDSGSGDQTTTAAAPSTGSAPSGGSCGAGVSVNAVTSCAFALNVASDYASSSSYTFVSYSPTTGQAYTMHCSGGDPVVCTGGNGAAVYIDF